MKFGSTDIDMIPSSMNQRSALEKPIGVVRSVTKTVASLSEQISEACSSPTVPESMDGFYQLNDLT